MADDVSIVEVVVRLLAAFALIVAVLGAAAYVMRRRGAIRFTNGARSQRLLVLERRQLTRSAAVAVVRVGDRSLLLGTTDSAVSLLADVSAEILEHDGAGALEDDQGGQRTGFRAGGDSPLRSRMDFVGAILQRMGRRT